jgi:dTDP-4-amino-4,6-dideoxygalactose transaminase
MKPPMGVLERNFADFIGVKYAILTNLGRTALYAALKAVNIKKGDEVLIPAYICEVVPNALHKIGAIPKFVDITSDGRFWLSMQDLERKLTSRVSGIIVNYCFGFINELDEMLRIVKDLNLVLIEDCAHALGGKNKRGVYVGSIGDAGVFSFSKSLPFNIGGGAITFNNEEFLGKMRDIFCVKSGLKDWLYQLYFGALSRVELKMSYSKKYELSFNIITKLSTKLPRKEYDDSLKIPSATKASLLQKVLLFMQMKHIDNLNVLRNDKYKVFLEILEGCSPILEIPPIQKKDVCTWIPFIFKEIEYKNKLMLRLKAYRIFLSPFWNPSLFTSADDCPNAIDISKRVLVIKLDHSLSNVQLAKIGEIIKKETKNI